MKRILKASEYKGSETTYFDIQVEENNELIRMIDLNGNYTEMYPEEAQELVNALTAAIKVFN